jgi:hypothetical protein
MSITANTREAISGSVSNWRLWLIQFLANPLLFALFAFWLLVPVSTVWFVILNALLGLGVLVAAVVLHAGTMNYFYDRYGNERAALKDDFRRALRNLLPFLLWAAVFCLLWLLIDRLDDYRYTLPIYIRSTLSASMRKHFTLSLLMTIYSVLVFVVRWLLLPGLLLPFAISAATFGFRGFGRKGILAWKSAVLSLSYWLVLILAALVGVFAAGKLSQWTSDFKSSTYHREMLSLVIRVFFAYLLGLWGWMLACSALGRRCGRNAEARADVAGNPSA